MPLNRVDERVNAIYDALDKVRNAQIRGDTATSRRSLAAGLAESCMFFTDAMEDVTLARVTVEPQSLTVLRRLHQQGKLDDFLEAERRLLMRTKLKQTAIDELIDEFKAVMRLPEAGWADLRGHLDRIRYAVCREAQDAGDAARSGGRLKLAFVGAGGVIVTLVNQVGFPDMVILPEVVGISTTIGTGLVVRAVSGWASAGGASPA